MNGPVSGRVSALPGRAQTSSLRRLVVCGMVPVRYYIILTLFTWGFLYVNFEFCPAVKFSLFLLHQVLAICFCLILWGVALVYLERKYRNRPGA